MLINIIQSTIRCLRCPNVMKLQYFETTMKKQNYSGWVHRRPVAVLNEEIVLDSAEEAIKNVPRKYIDNDPLHPHLKVRKRNKPPQKPVTRYISDDTYKPDGTPNIIKLADDDRKLSNLMLSLKSKKMRVKNHQILLEGRRLIMDAIKAQLIPEIIMFSRMTDVEKLELPAKGVKLYKIPYATLQLWSNLTTSPGVIGIFKYPESFEKESTADTLPLTIICDNVREPGNMGTIIRAAAGVGCERLILTKGCVDVWESKVLRSAAGAHFRVSISKSIEWDDIKTLISPNAKIFAADNDSTVNSGEAESDSSIADNCSESENNVNVENLEETAECSSTDPTVENEAENLEETAECSSTDPTVENEAENSSTVRKITVKELSNRIPVIPYYAADYTRNEVVLIVGGETEGLSYESVELLRDNDGVRVNVPLTNNIESLNTGMALGIVAFEIKRQFIIHKNSIIE